MSELNVNQVLQQMRALASQAQAPTANANQANASNFANAFTNALETVNDMQMQSGALKKSFENGDQNINLADVMIASQKASVAYQATLQVRNKLIEAYKEIMSMPI